MRGPWGFSDVYKALSTFHLSIFPLQYTPLTLVFIPAMDAVDNGCMQLNGTEVLPTPHLSPQFIRTQRNILLQFMDE